MDEQDVARLVRRVVVTSAHVDYLKDGRAAASVQFNGEPAVVRELLDLVAELSESGRPAPQTAEVLRRVLVQGNGAERGAAEGGVAE